MGKLHSSGRHSHHGGGWEATPQGAGDLVSHNLHEGIRGASEGSGSRNRRHTRHRVGTGAGAPRHHRSTGGTLAQERLQSRQRGHRLAGHPGPQRRKGPFTTSAGVLKREVTTTPVPEATVRWRGYLPSGPGQPSCSFNAGSRRVLTQRGAQGSPLAGAGSTCPLILFNTLRI